MGSPCLLSGILISPVVLAAMPCSALISGILETTRISICLMMASVAYIAAGSWATVYESAPDALLFCLAVDDNANRSWRRLDDGEDGELDLDAQPGVTAATSFSLWSSLCTPVVVRKLLSNLSRELEAEELASEGRPAYAA